MTALIEPLESRRLLADIIGTAFQYNLAPQTLAYQFNDDISAELGLSDLRLDGIGNGPLSPTGMTLGYDSVTNTATINLASQSSPAVIPDGRYEAILSEQAAPISAEHRERYFFLRGDFDHDADVDSTDQSYFISMLLGGTPTGPGHAAGDVNFDGYVNNQDIAPFSAQFSKTLADLTKLEAPGSIETQTLSSTSIRTLWTPPQQAMPPTGYFVYRSTDGTDFSTCAAVVPHSGSGIHGFDDTSLQHGTKYWYRVRPYTDGIGLGHTTDKSWSVTVLPAPDAVALEGGDQLVRVVWGDNSDTESAFRITLRRNGSPQEVVVDEVVPSELVSPDGKCSWLISGLDSSTSYDVTVAAIRDGGAVSSASVPFASSVTTNAGQAVPSDPEITAATAYNGCYTGVSYTVAPDPDPVLGGYRNQTVTIDVTGLPRHTFAKLSLSVDGWTEGNVAEGLTFTVQAGTFSATMVRQNDWPGPEAHWTLGDTVLTDWFEHVGSSLPITITASGFPEPASSENFWSLHSFSLSTGIPSVSVVAEDDVATEGADPADNGTFLFERSGPGENRALVSYYDLSGTADNGLDYQQLDGRVVFAPGETSKLVDVVPVNDGTPEGEENAIASVQDDGTIFVAGSPLEPSVTLADNPLKLDTSKVNVGLPKTGGTDTFFVRVLKSGKRVAVPAPLCVSKPAGVSVTFGEYSPSGERRVTVTSEGLIIGPGHKIVLGVEGDETIRLEMAVVITE